MADQVNLQDFVAGFLLETEEHLHSVNRNLVAAAAAARKDQAEPRAVRDLFRSLHTIKGLASMVGAEAIADIAHELEGLLRLADRAGGKLSEASLDLVMRGTRAIEERVREIPAKGIGTISPAPPALIEALVLAQQQGPASVTREAADLALSPELQKSLSASEREQISQATAAGRSVLLVEFKPSPEKSGRGINITAVRERLGKLGELIKVFPRTATHAPTGIAFDLLLVADVDPASIEMIVGEPGSVTKVNSPVVESAATEPAENGSAFDVMPSDQGSIRVDIRRLDDTLEQLSSLFVGRFKFERAVNELTAQGVDTRELKALLAENGRQLRRLRTAISETRMVSLSELLQRLPLVVRGITRGTGKSVNVNIHAGSAEVDKSVADKIFPAIVHLVRNAVDHALETKEERRSAGKAETGELSITCDDTSGTSLVLTISDDGRGIDREAVARKAGQAATENDEELLRQICTAGLSTSQELTRTSGRGMGMEIVKRTVEMLGGALSLRTAAGKGTSFILRVPVTVTIVDVLSFVAGLQNYVAPIAAVDEIVEVDPGSAVPMPGAEKNGRRAHLIQYRGQAIPLYSLDAVLDSQSDQRVAAKALVVRQNKRAVAFGVDRMIGQQEAVVRPLDDAFVRISGLAGATDLGDGRPTLVLDLAGLSAELLRKPGQLAGEP